MAGEVDVYVLVATDGATLADFLGRYCDRADSERRLAETPLELPQEQRVLGSAWGIGIRWVRIGSLDQALEQGLAGQGTFTVELAPAGGRLASASVTFLGEEGMVLGLGLERDGEAAVLLDQLVRRYHARLGFAAAAQAPPGDEAAFRRALRRGTVARYLGDPGE